MAEINVDTKKMHECGLDIIKLTTDLNEQLNGLFKRLEEVPDVTKEWVGDSAQKFVNLIKLEKKQYFKLNEVILERGKFLINSAVDLEDNIRKVKDNL